MMKKPLTAKERAGLQWFKENGPIGLFSNDPAVPSIIIRRRLLAYGFIGPTPTAQMQIIKYQITDAGNAEL